MTKSELIQHIADLNPHLYHRDVERIVTTIFDEIMHRVIVVVKEKASGNNGTKRVRLSRLNTRSPEFRSGIL